MAFCTSSRFHGPGTCVVRSSSTLVTMSSVDMPSPSDWRGSNETSELRIVFESWIMYEMSALGCWANASASSTDGSVRM